MFAHHGSLWWFWVAAAGFHAAMILVSWYLARRVRGRLVPGATGWLNLGLLGDALLFAGAAVVLALTAAAFAPAPAFAFMRLLCQAGFGEALLLSAWVAAAVLRERGAASALPAGLVSVALLGLYLYAYRIEPFNLQVRRHELSHDHPNDVVRTLRVAHLSDIQTASVGAHEERALRAALAERPDLILLTGDYVQPGVLAPHRRAEEELRRLLVRTGLRAPLGVFAVQGDVDRDWPGIFAGLEVDCLRDDFALVPLPGGRRLSLVGLGLRTSRGRSHETLSRIVSRAPRGDVRIVMGHSPDFVAALAGGPAVDLALAGHTHGGQVVLPLIGPPLTLSRLPRRFASGLNGYRGIPLHVSPGIGVERGTAPPIRFRCPPAICLLELRY